MVAETRGTLVGFGAIVPENNELRACYVSSKATCRGVGRALVEELENIARDCGLDHLWLDSSVTAEGFYRRLGYGALKRGKHWLRDGMSMDCVSMRKKMPD